MPYPTPLEHRLHLADLERAFRDARGPRTTLATRLARFASALRPGSWASARKAGSPRDAATALQKAAAGLASAVRTI